MGCNGLVLRREKPEPPMSQLGRVPARGHPLQRRRVRRPQYASGSLLGRLQIWLPCVHRYVKVWICGGAPEITRVEPYSIEPLRIFPLAKCVGVREDVAAM